MPRSETGERDFAIEVVRRLREAGHEALWAGGNNRVGVEEELSRAQALIDETGGVIYEPLVRDLKAKLYALPGSVKTDSPRIRPGRMGA